jgi:hypothetical protein
VAPTHRQSSAGQASLEYVAVIALVAALLVFAGPALGAREIPRQVVHSMRLAICIVADDVCRREDALAAGLKPCVEAGQTKGIEGGFTVFSVDVGANDQLTGYRESDGSISLVWSAGGSFGLAGGFGLDGAAGPLSVELGPTGAVRERVQAARAWHFPDVATARRFIAGMPASAHDQGRWPAAWNSAEAGGEVAAGVHAAVGGADLVGLAASGSFAGGARFALGGVVTLYTRVSFDEPEATLPLVPSYGGGRATAMLEYTFDRNGPRELALRQLEPSDGGNRLTETVVRLPLRTNSLNLVYARPLIDVKLPWSPRAEARAIRAIIAQAHEMGTIERSVYDIDDTSRGASGAVKEGIEFGAGGKSLDVHKSLSDASAWTPGSRERDRFDCAEG